MLDNGTGPGSFALELAARHQRDNSMAGPGPDKSLNADEESKDEGDGFKFDKTGAPVNLLMQPESDDEEGNPLTP